MEVSLWKRIKAKLVINRVVVGVMVGRHHVARWL